MNQPFFWAFLITYLLSFDAAIQNPVAGGISFIGSTLGVMLTAFNSLEK